VTVVSLLAASYVDRAATYAAKVADIMASSRKTEKHCSLSSMYMFEPIAAGNLCVLSSSRLDFLVELGRRICLQSNDARESSYLLQHISVAIERFNSLLFHDSLTVNTPDL